MIKILLYVLYCWFVRFPLKGTGDKYGASVSTRILSDGICLKVSASSSDFLNVITPSRDICTNI